MSILPLSVLILTHNEEVNLPGCLDSVQGCDDIVVYDSFSSDRTVEIARATGARVYQRRFDNYATQRNAALTQVDYTHPWILMLDADERLTLPAAEEIRQALTSDTAGIGIYRMRRRDMFMGRWLRRSSGYPTWFARILRVGHVHVQRQINEEYHTDGEVRYLQGHIDHFPFNKGIAYWFARHNRYSSMEAETLLQEMGKQLAVETLISSDPVVRRRFLKQLAYRLPFRPLAAFAYLYVFRLGFLDGRAGFAYCALRSIYEYMIDLKMLEIRRREQGLTL